MKSINQFTFSHTEPGDGGAIWTRELVLKADYEKLQHENESLRKALDASEERVSELENELQSIQEILSSDGNAKAEPAKEEEDTPDSNDGVWKHLAFKTAKEKAEILESYVGKKVRIRTMHNPSAKVYVEGTLTRMKGCTAEFAVGWRSAGKPFPVIPYAEMSLEFHIDWAWKILLLEEETSIPNSQEMETPTKEAVVDILEEVNELTKELQEPSEPPQGIELGMLWKSSNDYERVRRYLKEPITVLTSTGSFTGTLTQVRRAFGMIHIKTSYGEVEIHGSEILAVYRTVKNTTGIPAMWVTPWVDSDYLPRDLVTWAHKEGILNQDTVAILGPNEMQRANFLYPEHNMTCWDSSKLLWSGVSAKESTPESWRSVFLLPGSTCTFIPSPIENYTALPCPEVGMIVVGPKVEQDPKKRAAHL